MPDRFSTHAAGLESPASHGFSIAPDDGADLAETTRAIYAGGGGNVALVLASGGEIVFSNVQVGALLPIRVRRVKATGTTATNLVGLV